MPFILASGMGFIPHRFFEDIVVFTVRCSTILTQSGMVKRICDFGYPSVFLHELLTF